jgi:hypothetical protein
MRSGLSEEYTGPWNLLVLNGPLVAATVVHVPSARSAPSGNTMSGVAEQHTNGDVGGDGTLMLIAMAGRTARLMAVRSADSESLGLTSTYVPVDVAGKPMPCIGVTVTAVVNLGVKSSPSCRTHQLNGRYDSTITDVLVITLACGSNHGMEALIFYAVSIGASQNAALYHRLGQCELCPPGQYAERANSASFEQHSAS